LVHGAWADGSSWSGVIERLQSEGYSVSAPQFPMTSLADDVARLRHVLKLQNGPTVVVTPITEIPHSRSSKFPRCSPGVG